MQKGIEVDRITRCGSHGIQEPVTRH